jgi:hypothetical protein
MELRGTTEFTFASTSSPTVILDTIQNVIDRFIREDDRVSQGTVKYLPPAKFLVEVTLETSSFAGGDDAMHDLMADLASQLTDVLKLWLDDASVHKLIMEDSFVELVAA